MLVTHFSKETGRKWPVFPAFLPPSGGGARGNSTQALLFHVPFLGGENGRQFSPSPGSGRRAKSYRIRPLWFFGKIESLYCSVGISKSGWSDSGISRTDKIPTFCRYHFSRRSHSFQGPKSHRNPVILQRMESDFPA